MDSSGNDGFTDLGEWLVEDALGIPSINSGDVIRVLRSDDSWAFENSSGEPVGSYSRHSSRAVVPRNHLVACSLSTGTYLRLNDLPPDMHVTPSVLPGSEVSEPEAIAAPEITADRREALPPTPGALPDSPQSRRHAMARDRWQYCKLSYGDKEVEYWTTSGVRKEKMRDFPLAVAELGEQGWEMTVGLPGVLLFRRRVEAV